MSLLTRKSQVRAVFYSILLLSWLALAACNGTPTAISLLPTGTLPILPTTPPATVATATPATPTPTVQPPALTPTPTAASYTWNLVVNGLDKPDGIANAGDGSGRLFVLEQPGTVRIIKAGLL